MLRQLIGKATKINTLTRIGFYVLGVHISSIGKKFLVRKKELFISIGNRLFSFS